MVQDLTQQTSALMSPFSSPDALYLITVFLLAKDGIIPITDTAKIGTPLRPGIIHRLTKRSLQIYLTLLKFGFKIRQGLSFRDIIRRSICSITAF